MSTCDLARATGIPYTSQFYINKTGGKFICSKVKKNNTKCVQCIYKQVGCQLVYFHHKFPFWRVLERMMLVHFMYIRTILWPLGTYILLPSGIFCDHQVNVFGVL
jgi:hypothetical protein